MSKWLWIKIFKFRYVTSDSTRRFCFAFLSVTAASLFDTAEQRIFRHVSCFREISCANQSDCSVVSFPATTTCAVQSRCSLVSSCSFFEETSFTPVNINLLTPWTTKFTDYVRFRAKRFHFLPTNFYAYRCRIEYNGTFSETPCTLLTALMRSLCSASASFKRYWRSCFAIWCSPDISPRTDPFSYKGHQNSWNTSAKTFQTVVTTHSLTDSTVQVTDVKVYSQNRTHLLAWLKLLNTNEKSIIIVSYNWWFMWLIAHNTAILQ